MPETTDLKTLLETPRYQDRGGFKVLKQIFRANLPYELKLQNASETFKVSPITARRWYALFRALEGLR